jgi:hypothetical protein
MIPAQWGRKPSQYVECKYDLASMELCRVADGVHRRRCNDENVRL